MKRYVSLITAERVLALILVPSGLLLTHLAFDFPFLSRLLPVGALLVVVGGILLLCIASGEKVNFESLLSQTALRFSGIAVLFFLYALSFAHIGFFISTPLFMLLSAMLLGVRNWLWILGSIVTLNLLIWVIFRHYLGVPLP